MIIKKNEAQNITELMQELFTTHELEFEIYDNWIIPVGEEYGMKAYWYPEATDAMGQLSIELFINSEMIMVESFPGLGESHAQRLENAFASFLHHAFPTFLAAVWQKPSKEVNEEQWNIDGINYHVYIGNQGILNYNQNKEIVVPQSYATKVKDFICSEKLDKEMHWFNLFYANMNGLQGQAEVLKDNSKYPSGAKMLEQLNWTRSNNYYAVRQFIILKRV